MEKFGALFSVALGSWLSIDVAQVTGSPPGQWRGFTSPSFELRILDAGGSLSGENITGGMHTRTWIHGKKGRNHSHQVTSKPPVPILVERTLTNAPTASFTAFGWVVGPKGVPDKRTAEGDGRLQIDARGAASIGLQAQFTQGQGCISQVHTTVPKGSAIDVQIPKTTSPCILRMRLCSTPQFSQHDEGSSCARLIAPSYATRLD